MKEKATGRINVSSDSQTVEDILTHIYGGRIENMEEKAGKLEAEKKRRVGALIAKQEEVERRKLRHEKVARMKVARALSQERARKEKMAAKGGGGGRKRKRIEK